MISIKTLKVAAFWLFFISISSPAQNCLPSWCPDAELGEAETRICQESA